MNRLRKVERVAAYIRVSTQEQKLHGISLDAQKAKLLAYAKKHDMKIVEWYMDEGVSGRKLIKKRPELQRMIQDAEADKFDRIIFIKLDRFFRSVAEYHECMKRIAPVVWTTTEEEYDLTTANGRMLVNMKLTIAEMEADLAGERIDLVNEYKTSTGQPLTGAMPFGFKITIDTNTGRKKIVKDEEVSYVLEDAIEHFLTYQSKRKTLIYLHAKYHVALNYNALSRLLCNPMLYGAYRDNLNYCEAYTDKPTYDKMQEILKRNVKTNTADNREYIFSGLIKCPLCGRVLTGTAYTNIKKTGKRYVYKKYKCHNFKANNACTFRKEVSENVIQKKLLLNMKQLLDNAKIESFGIEDANKPSIPKYNLEEINAQIDRLNYSWQTGKIRKVEQYEKQYAELTEKLHEAEAEQKVTPKDFSKIEDILHSGWENIYTALDDEHKKAFWRNLISSIELEWTDDVKQITKVNFF